MSCWVFQSTHPHGVRLNKISRIFSSTKVSIHAPTRGATRRWGRNVSLTCLFQSTHPHGVRHDETGHRSDILSFQSTHPHGVRRYVCKRFIELYKFQSTHPHGVRLNESKSRENLNNVSIHAPTRGATQHPKTQLCATGVFQSTHPHGVRPSKFCVDFTLSVFQSTHPHGVRQHAIQGDVEQTVFQSTHPHGVRLGT